MWRKDKANGRGRMTHSNGDIYEGSWKDDKAHGFGIFIDSSNAKYEGFWLDDLQHGQGIETWGNGNTNTLSMGNGMSNENQATFIGIFFKGKKNGKGRF